MRLLIQVFRILIGPHVWAVLESYEVLEYLFGDFFIEDYPINVEYTGVYR